MANDIIDINVYETTETVAITVNPNLTTINVNTVTGGGLVTSVNGQIGNVVIATSDNNFTTVLKNKLDGIAAGAQVNVNADWNATNGYGQILNKPTIPNVSLLVPYTGATSNLNLGSFDIYLERVFLNDSVNGGYASIHYADGNFHIEDPDGHKLLVIEDGFIQLHQTDTIQSNLFTTNLTVTRNHFLPNKSGTIALLSDIPTISGTTNYIPKFTGASYLGNSSIFDNGNVGIGTTNPLHKIDLNFSNSSSNGNYINVRDIVTDASAKIGCIKDTGLTKYSGIWLNQTTPSFTNYSFLGQNNNIFFNAYLEGFIDFRVSNSSKMMMTNTGNLLINTTVDNGVDKLQVNGSLIATTIKKLSGTSDQILLADGSTSSLAGKENAITSGTTSQYFRGDKTFQTLDKTAVGLGNVNNTSDENKPVSTDTQTALNLKANIASPTFTGTVVLPSTTSIGNVSATELGYLDNVTSNIQTQLNSTVKVLLNEFPNTSVTGFSAETLLSTFVIPANTFQASCLPNIKLRFTKLNDAGATTIRLKFNSTNNFATSFIMGLYQATSTTDSFIFVRNPLITGGQMTLALPTGQILSDESTVGSQDVSRAFDPTVTNHFFISAENSTALDTTTVTTLRAIKIIN